MTDHSSKYIATNAPKERSMSDHYAGVMASIKTPRTSSVVDACVSVGDAITASFRDLPSFNPNGERILNVDIVVGCDGKANVSVPPGPQAGTFERGLATLEIKASLNALAAVLPPSSLPFQAIYGASIQGSDEPAWDFHAIGIAGECDRLTDRRITQRQAWIRHLKAVMDLEFFISDIAKAGKYRTADYKTFVPMRDGRMLAQLRAPDVEIAALTHFVRSAKHTAVFALRMGTSIIDVMSAHRMMDIHFAEMKDDCMSSHMARAIGGIRSREAVLAREDEVIGA